MSSKKKYDISFHTEKQNKKNEKFKTSNLQKEDLKEILFSNVNPQKENFSIYDYNSNLTINSLKEYFLLTFGNKYKYCPCVLFVYYLQSSLFGQDKLILLDVDDNRKLSEFNYNHFYIIKRDSICDCEIKEYNKYMNMQKTDIVKQLKDLKIECSKLENVEKENEEYKKKIKELEEENNFLKKTEELKIFKNLVFENFYDVIIKIDSIRDLNKEGWKVKMNEKGIIQYNKHKNESYLRIGVIGNTNKGKSFLLSKISKIDLASGYSIQTEGLSIKYPDLKDHKDRNIILLDSAGLETPVFKSKNIEKEKEVEVKDNKNEQKIQEKNERDEIEKIDKEQNKEFKENARDKIMTELFLQNFIIRSSDILLLVVGKLTYSEQLLINKIKHEGKRLKKDRIFIVHNLQEFSIVKEVENYITNILLNCSTFNLKKNKIVDINKNVEEIPQKEEKNKEIKKEEIKNEEEEIKNNEIINEENKNEINDEENKNEINDEDKNEIKNDENKNEIINQPKKKNLSIDQIEVIDEPNLNNIHFYEVLYYDEKRKIDIYHLILAKENSEAGKVFNNYTYKFIENIYNTVTEIKKFDLFEEVKTKFKDLSSTILNNNVSEANFSSNDEIMKNKIIKLNLKEDLSLKKCYMDELGFSFFKTGDFEPKYNYFKPNENTLEIRMEIPGNTDCSAKHIVEGEETKIIVTGNKNIDSSPEKFEDNLFNIREFSKFEVVIPLKVEKYKINSPNPKEGYPKIKNGVFVVQYELAQAGKEAKAEAKGL